MGYIVPKHVALDGPLYMGSIYSNTDATKEIVHYQTLSPKSLAKSVLEEGGWSSLIVSISLVKLKLSCNFSIMSSCIETSIISSLMS